MNESIIIKLLSKSYRKLKVISELNLEISKGKIIGLIGRNGSGKSTLIKSIMKFINIDSGAVEINGVDTGNMDILDIGYFLREANFYPNFTGCQNLEYFLNLREHELSKFSDLFEMFDMTEALGRKYKTYSMGMKQRFGLIFLLMQEKSYLLLDEPMSNLDFFGRQVLKKIVLRKVKEDNCGVLIVSHQLESIDGFCDEIWYMENQNIKNLKNVTKNVKYKLIFANENSCKEMASKLLKTKLSDDLKSFEVTVNADEDIEEIISEASKYNLREVRKLENTILNELENMEKV